MQFGLRCTYSLPVPPAQVPPQCCQVRRVINERTDDGPWQALVDVAADDVMDVLGALRRAYQDGQEDRSGGLLAPEGER